METPIPDDITKQLLLRTLRSDGTRECRRIRPISEEEAFAYRSLGHGCGTDLNTALAMMYQHCPGFFDRAAAYRVTPLPEDVEIRTAAGEPGIAIRFFERATRRSAQGSGT